MRWRRGHADKPKRFGETVLTGFYILALVVSTIGWLAALGWIAYLLIKRLL
jgi:hypothetical protein